MELRNKVQVVYARNREEWRKWLQKNYATQKSVWLVIYNMESQTPSVYYPQAVEEALCFGWIDSIANKRDTESRYQFFSVRKPKSKWSRANRQRAEEMIAQNKMQPAGQAMIDLAKKTGTWTALEEVQNNVVPFDLQQALNKNKPALKNFTAFSPSSKRIILEWILNAKKPETRNKRIAETVALAAKNIKANHYRQ